MSEEALQEMQEGEVDAEEEAASLPGSPKTAGSGSNSGNAGRESTASVPKEPDADDIKPPQSTGSNVSNVTDTGELRPGSSAESNNQGELPMAPKSSRMSYDGPAHHQHKEARSNEVHDALYRLVEDEGKEAQDDMADLIQGLSEPSNKDKTYAFSARWYDEKKIMRAIRRVQPKHEFGGYVFSKRTPRPHGISNFFLPSLPQPTSRRHVAAKVNVVPPDVIRFGMKSAPAGLMPLSTLRVTWCLNPNRTIYSAHDLYAYLSRFGSIEAIYQRSPNAALVVFVELASARDCMKCPELGMPWDQLIASWWEPKMHNQGYFAKYLRLEEHNNMLAVSGPVLRDEKTHPSDKAPMTPKVPLTPA